MKDTHLREIHFDSLPVPCRDCFPMNSLTDWSQSDYLQLCLLKKLFWNVKFHIVFNIGIQSIQGRTNAIEQQLILGAWRWRRTLILGLQHLQQKFFHFFVIYGHRSAPVFLSLFFPGYIRNTMHKISVKIQKQERKTGQSLSGTYHNQVCHLREQEQ